MAARKGPKFGKFRWHNDGKNESLVTRDMRRQIAETEKEVRQAFDARALRRICTAPEPHFAEYGQPTVKAGTFYFARQQARNVLAVAHLDSVVPATSCEVTETAAGYLITASSLDDRLGAYVILELLPALGVQTDILLTTGEESGNSSASLFDSEHDYGWMFQFDRTGTDVVMYDYETTEMRRLLQTFDFRVAMGSFSDICSLQHLGCKGFNFGVGYQNYHSRRAHAWWNDTVSMVARFLVLYRTHAATRWPHKRTHWSDNLSAAWSSEGWNPTIGSQRFMEPTWERGDDGKWREHGDWKRKVYGDGKPYLDGGD